MLELRQTFELLEQLLEQPDPTRPQPQTTAREQPIGVGRVESPRGATSCIIERNRRPHRAAAPAHRLLRQLALARRTSPPATSSPTSRSSTRASSSATPAPTADVRPLPRPTPPPTRHRPAHARTVRAASRSATSTPAPATAANTNSPSPPAPTTTSHRYGLGIVASPRHADVLLVTGAITTRMHLPLLTAYDAMPEPRCVAALGDCALGCNLLGNPEQPRRPARNDPPRRPPHPRLPPDPGRDRASAPLPYRPVSELAAELLSPQSRRA